MGGQHRVVNWVDRKQNKLFVRISLINREEIVSSKYIYCHSFSFCPSRWANEIIWTVEWVVRMVD